MVYLITGIINKGIPFIMIPVLTFYLSPKDYGYIAIFQLIISFAHPLQNLNGNLYIAKEYHGSSNEEINLINGSYVTVVSLFTILFLILLFIANLFFEKSFVIHFHWWVIAIVIGIFGSIYLNHLTLLRCQDKPMVYAALEIIKSVLDVGVTIVFLMVFKFGWKGRVLGIITSITILGIYSIFMMWRHKILQLKFSRVTINKILKFSLPLIPFSFGTMIINFSDRLFIQKICGVSELGIYAVAYSIGMSLMVFTESFNKAWTPAFFKKAADYEENKYQLYKLIGLYTVIVLILPIIIYMLSKYLLFKFFISAKYINSLKYILGIAYAYAFKGFS